MTLFIYFKRFHVDTGLLVLIWSISLLFSGYATADNAVILLLLGLISIIFSMEIIIIVWDGNHWWGGSCYFSFVLQFIITRKYMLLLLVIIITIITIIDLIRRRYQKSVLYQGEWTGIPLLTPMVPHGEGQVSATTMEFWFSQLQLLLISAE